jgi:hypothetical protein
MYAYPNFEQYSVIKKITSVFRTRPDFFQSAAGTLFGPKSSPLPLPRAVDMLTIGGL